MSATSAIRHWADAGLSFLYPEVCALCQVHRASVRDGFVCAECRQDVRFVRPPFCRRCGLPFDGEVTAEFECSNCRDLTLHFSSARSAVIARTVVLEAIHRFKYSRHLWFEPFLAELFLREAVPALRVQPADLIVPVPLFPAREREREFNQAERLAAHLSAASGIRLEKRLLQRVLPTLTQTHLSKTGRAGNIQGDFNVRADAKLNGERVVLVDDVFTTGATTSECARILRRAGAGEVAVWTVARGA
ncbi:MAG TPA: ComF family protein [Verrucomicrobiae bacterium]|nr:ComF family protein [Verrucomicrobiae bacterium]